MNRFVAIEYLKTYFGTLFLMDYMFPSNSRINQLLFETWSDLVQTKSLQTLHALGYLQRLVKSILKHEDELLTMSNSNFLKKHKDRMMGTGVVFPYNERRSIEMFFINFLNADFCPQNEEELHEIVQWSLLVVQFEEANTDRTRAALAFLRIVEVSIEHHFKHVDDNVVAPANTASNNDNADH